ncbi:MAG: nucleoside deaminase [Candidatus Babeliales bacterium]
MICNMDDKKAHYMSLALKQAQRALNKGEVPVGAIIVNQHGAVIARAYNKVETLHCQTAHAEALAIQKACKKLGDWRLNGCCIYVTLEPCLMCIGLIQLSRIESIVFGTRSRLFGSGLGESPKSPAYARGLDVTGGVGAGESVTLLRAFFKTVRAKKEKGRP